MRVESELIKVSINSDLPIQVHIEWVFQQKAVTRLTCCAVRFRRPKGNHFDYGLSDAPKAVELVSRSPQPVTRLAAQPVAKNHRLRVSWGVSNTQYSTMPDQPAARPFLAAPFWLART